MDPTPASASAAGGGPAPFLLKTYDMVDDSATDDIVSWSSSMNSFVVWNPPELARVLLPTYFKHNNFSSFIRQLNTYGFRKIDPEKWEFANEDFVKDQKQLLKNIHRRKPVHSHSHPQGSAVDLERAAFKEEIEKLSHEKAALEANLLRCEQQRSVAKIQIEELTRRFNGMEQRQEKLFSFLEKAVQDPTFVERLAFKMESMDVSADKKKRRLPQIDGSKSVSENSLFDSDRGSRPEVGTVFDQDFSSKLRLELSPAISDINLGSSSTQSSNEDGLNLQMNTCEGNTGDARTRIECTLFTPEAVDHSDIGKSFKSKMDLTILQVHRNESSRVNSLQQGLSLTEDIDGNICCQLTLASSPLQINKSACTAALSEREQGQEVVRTPWAGPDANPRDSFFISSRNNRNMVDEETQKRASKEALMKNQEHAAPPPPVRVNDVFWEQFLTERPGSSDKEEDCSSNRANPYEAQDGRSVQTLTRILKSAKQLSL